MHSNELVCRECLWLCSPSPNLNLPTKCLNAMNLSSLYIYPNSKFSAVQLRNKLRKIKTRKAAGPDCISSRLIRSCADKQMLFNISPKLGDMPPLIALWAWKRSMLALWWICSRATSGLDDSLHKHLYLVFLNYFGSPNGLFWSESKCSTGVVVNSREYRTM